MTLLTVSAVIGTALVGGIFFAFSTFVMRALARLDPREGIAAMQSINVVVLNPWFFAVFFGAGVVCIATAIVALSAGAGPRRTAALVGGALYLLGCIGVTGARNVPLNDRLARASPGDDGAASLWRIYVQRWNRWNHVRTAASLSAAAAFAVAMGSD